MNVQLSDIEQLCFLISDEDHFKVGNLFIEDTKRLDQVSEIIGLDLQKLQYFKRSREGDQTGYTKTASYFGWGSTIGVRR